MSATGEDQNIADALLVRCGLPGCERPPGEACVNSVVGGPRDEPHWNRVVRGRRAELDQTRETLAVYRQELAAERNDAADTEKERDLLRSELTRLRADLADERATLAQVVADYADAADELQLLRPTIPTSKEKTMPATSDDGPILGARTTVTIYGASDDLIEIDGDIYEEFSHFSDEPALLAFSDGTVLRIVHDQDGIWRITPVVTGSASLTHVFGQDDREHTDKATLNGDVRWVVYGTTMATNSKAATNG